MKMKLVVIVLNKIECMEELLKEFADRGLPGATILQSHGMMHRCILCCHFGISSIRSTRKTVRSLWQLLKIRFPRLSVRSIK